MAEEDERMANTSQGQQAPKGATKLYCNFCSQETEGKKRCDDCGNLRTVTCGKCNKIVTNGPKCPNCGETLTAATTSPKPSPMPTWDCPGCAKTALPMTITRCPQCGGRRADQYSGSGVDISEPPNGANGSYELLVQAAVPKPTDIFVGKDPAVDVYVRMKSDGRGKPKVPVGGEVWLVHRNMAGQVPAGFTRHGANIVPSNDKGALVIHVRFDHVKIMRLTCAAAGFDAQADHVDLQGPPLNAANTNDLESLYRNAKNYRQPR